MTTPSQRQVFLDGEGDAWFQRNQQVDADQVAYWVDQDPLAELLENLPLPRGPEVSVVEVGCGQGLRLARLRQVKGWSVAGLDPSERQLLQSTLQDVMGWWVLRRHYRWQIDL